MAHRVRRLVQAHFIGVLGLLLPSIPLVGTELVTDNATKLEILKAAFPNSMVSVSTQTPLNWKPSVWAGLKATDALEGETEYVVVGAADKFEEAYGMDVLTLDVSKQRRLRLRVYETTASKSENRTFVALAHYKFTGIQNYAVCCEWFARLLVLSHRTSGWIVDHSNTPLVYRAKTVSSFRLVDLDGDGVDEILVEGDITLAGYVARFTYIYTTYGSRLVQLARVETFRLGPYNFDEVWYARELDLDKTRESGGKTLYFTTTFYGTERTRYRTPRTSEFVVKPRPQRPD